MRRRWKFVRAGSANPPPLLPGDGYRLPTEAEVDKIAAEVSKLAREVRIMSLESMIAALTPSEKLAAMDILWRDLSANTAEFTSPAWHGDVLNSRLAQPSSNPRLPLDAAIEDVKDRLNARRTQGRCQG